MGLFLSVLTSYVVVLLFAGCAQGPVAEVNGEKITRLEYKQTLRNKMAEHGDRGANVDEKTLSGAVIEELISRKLLAQEAKQRNVTVSDKEVNDEAERVRSLVGKEEFAKELKKNALTIKSFKENIRMGMLMDRLSAAIVPEDSISESELKSYYANSPHPFLNPEKVEVRFIQTTTEGEANDILREMKEKKTGFDQMAKSLADNKNVVTSEYGWTQTSFYSPTIGQAINSLKEGGYGGPYKGKDGYFLISLRKKQPAGVKSFEEAKAEIRRILLETKRQDMLAHVIGEKRKNADVKIF